MADPRSPNRPSSAPLAPRFLIGEDGEIVPQPTLAPSHGPAAPPLVTGRTADPRKVQKRPLAPPPAPPSAWSKAETIGAPKMGEHYLPASFNEILGSENPAPLIAEHLLGGGGRPRSLREADPYGVDTFLAGKGPMPMFMGTTEEVPTPRGLYSRVDDIAARVPEKGIHPNKLASLLKQGASSEEVAYRNLPALISGKAAANQPITRAELAAHLAEHPAPFPKVVTHGAYQRSPEIQAELDEITRQRDYGGQISHAQWQRKRDEILAREAAPPPTKFKQYTLPGGENYREDLLTLPPEMKKQGRYKARIRNPSGQVVWEHPDIGKADIERVRQRWASTHPLEYEEIATPVSGYQSPHWDEPNPLAHARTTERSLPPPDLPTALPEHYQVHQDRNGKFYYQTPDGTGGVQDYATAEQATRAAMEHAGLLNESRGRFIEEGQSDWMQEGRDQGFRGPDDEAALQAAKRAREEAIEARGEYKDQFVASWRPPTSEHPFEVPIYEEWLAESVPAEYRTPDHESVNKRLYKDAVGAMQQRYNMIDSRARANALQADPIYQQLTTDQLNAEEAFAQHVRRQSNAVPDAPFKENWHELQLKQQLLEAAKDPHINWLGTSGAQTHIDRWGSERLTWAPHPEGGFRVTFEPQVAGNALGGDLGADALAAGYTHNNTEVVRSIEELESLLSGSKVKAAKAWKRITGAPEGGTYLPRKEGMEAFYEREYPGTLRKLLKPFGGAVDPFQVPGTATPGRYQLHIQRGGADLSPVGPIFSTPEEAAAWRPAWQGEVRAVTPPAPAASGWLANLTPEIKAAINKRGFPLMMLPLGVAAASLGARESDGGTPPPVLAPQEPR